MSNQAQNIPLVVEEKREATALMTTTTTSETTTVTPEPTVNSRVVSPLEALKAVMNDLPFQPSVKTYDMVEAAIKEAEAQKNPHLTLLEVSTQYWENYSDTNTPHWKPKGEQKFHMYVDSDTFMYLRDDCVKVLQIMLSEQSNFHCRYTYVAHEFIFSEPILLSGSVFESKLKEVLDSSK